MSSIPVIGEIFNPPDYLPPYTQPGGPGTATFPAQQTGELLGQFMFGCGHSMNNIEVGSTQIGGVQSAIIMCPLCHYVQAILTPYSLIDDYQNLIY